MSNVRPAEETDGHRATTWQRAVLRARRMHLAQSLLVAVAALVIGIGVGRWSVPEADPDIRATVEGTVQPLALDADAIWTSGSVGDRPSIAEGIPLVHRGERLEDVRAWSEDWLSAYDNALVRLSGLDLRAEARPVQRQFVNAITLSRDAVEVLRHATGVEHDATREVLVADALRLRQRGEHLTQAARASVRDLAGGDGEVSQHPPLPEFGEVTEQE